MLRREEAYGLRRVLLLEVDDQWKRASSKRTWEEEDEEESLNIFSNILFSKL